MWLALLAMLVGPVVPAAAEAPPVSTPGSPALAGQSDPIVLAAWASTSGDAGGRPFVIVDKLAARVLVFDAGGALVAQTPALLGMGVGDTSPPGIGTMRLADITPALRVTPAGRYDAHLGVNLAGHAILWIDYDAALSLHAVVTGNAAEHRLERLATPSILDNRISYGCINVPAEFFEHVVAPLFERTNAVVYILPESAP
jgi:hypothetical protein